MGTPRRRAAEACSFCRRRKIKCNNERPVCLTCRAYGHECSYEPVSQDAKEAGRKRHHRSKRRRVTGQDSASVEDDDDDGDDASHPNGDGDQLETGEGGSITLESSATPVRDMGRGGNEDIRHASPLARTQRTPITTRRGSKSSPLVGRAPEASVARILVSANGVSSYHGRTSALFEDSIPERAVEGDICPRMPDDWVERGLVAEAARQRQMEEINYHEGKLDFDGVDPELGMHLLSLHWNRQHHSFLITYRPAFMRDMACGGPYFSKLLLNAIYFGASKFSARLEVRRDPDDVRTAGWQYRERVRELLGSSLDRSDITTIQALLQMTNSLFALGDERSAAWLYSGLAFRMLIDLGMHVDLTTTGRFSDEDLEIRRRVFWGAFVVDKIQSLYQGRPVSLKETDALVPIRFLDTYEELEYWKPFAYSTTTASNTSDGNGRGNTGSPAYSTSTFTYLCKLSIVMSDILGCIYTERSFDQSPADLSGVLERLQAKLQRWRETLPAHLQFDPAKAGAQRLPPPHVFSLHAMYNVLVILLHRPFVADGHLYSTSRSISVDSFMKCASAASNISSLLRAYHRAFSIRRAPYLISYATYVAATIHTRIAARRGSDSAAHTNLVTCLAVFEENQETNSAVKKAALIVRGLMKKHGVVVEEVSGSALDMDTEPAKSREADKRLPQHGARRIQQQYARERSIPAASQGETRGSGPEGEEGSSGVATGNSAEASHSAAATVRSGQTGYSPGSDWLDVDGIIQNFLMQGDGAPEERVNPALNNTESAPGHLPRDQWVFQQQQQQVMMGQDMSMEDQAIMGSDHPHQQQQQHHPQEGAYAAGYPSQQASLEDPLFGFNGSSIDGFPFMGW